MHLNEEIWKAVQARLRYTEEEMAIFRNNPRNADVLANVGAFMNKTIVVEVVESAGCNSQHKAGDRFIFDSAGNLLTKLNPSRICSFALCRVLPLMHAAIELIYAGADPNGMRFKRTGCFDTGVLCGGWGHIVMEIRVEDRKKQQLLE